MRASLRDRESVPVSLTASGQRSSVTRFLRTGLRKTRTLTAHPIFIGKYLLQRHGLTRMPHAMECQACGWYSRRYPKVLAHSCTAADASTRQQRRNIRRRASKGQIVSIPE